MVIIFGSKGYMGSAIASECRRRDIVWTAGVRENTKHVVEQIAWSDLVINCAAFIPSPTVDDCRLHQGETIRGNVLWPQRLKEACSIVGIPLIHLSTGCLFDEQREYTEEDIPTRGWNGYCGFYVGTKLMAEEAVREWGEHYILRLRLPFDEFDHPRNYLTKLAQFDNVFDHINSLTHRGDFAKWVLDLWQQESPFGTYHCVNQHQSSAYDLITAMSLRRMIGKPQQVIKNSNTTGARLSCQKLMAVGVKVRSVHDAIADSLKNWKSA